MTMVTILTYLLAILHATHALIASETNERALPHEVASNIRRESFGQIVMGALLPAAVPPTVNAADVYPYRVSTCVLLLGDPYLAHF